MLTDREREALRQIEQALSGDDPRLARLLGASGRLRGRWRFRRAFWLAALAVAALVGLALGLALSV
jgi:Protein of unknown function (DUF3040)